MVLYKKKVRQSLKIILSDSIKNTFQLLIHPCFIACKKYRSAGKFSLLKILIRVAFKEGQKMVENGYSYYENYLADKKSEAA